MVNVIEDKQRILVTYGKLDEAQIQKYIDEGNKVIRQYKSFRDFIAQLEVGYHKYPYK